MNKVKVCDALCGAGKTTACINMINASDKRFIFITPYLKEADRIVSSCAAKEFVKPESRYFGEDGDISRHNKTKLQDVHDLLRQGKNIASTHALFTNYTDETKELIRSQGYTLILDEVLDLFRSVGIDKRDIKLLLRNNIASKRGDEVVWDDEEYDGPLFNEIMYMSKSKNLVEVSGSLFYWLVPMDVFECFEKIYLMTYLFEFQPLRYFFEIGKIPYELIGVRKAGKKYELCKLSEMDRRVDLKSKIHIMQNDKLNDIGVDHYALSARWFERNLKEKGQPNIARLKNNVENVFRHHYTDSKSDNRMWSSISRFKKVMKGRGYTSGFVAFNARASNRHDHRKYLAYCVNVFLQPWLTSYLKKLGIEEINQDMYALSVLVQWVFRSAIRKGEEIWIYIPSRRMRKVFEIWLDNLERGEDLKPITVPVITRRKGGKK